MKVSLDQHHIQHAPMRHSCRSSHAPVMLDQHFMTDLKTLEKIAAAAELTAKDVVVEIGAGTGNLTRVLSSTKASITAIELDPRLAAELEKRFSHRKNVKVIEGNALKMLKKLKFNKIVANIPYAICEPLMRLLRTLDFDEAVMTIPEKFAKNITSDSTMLGLESSVFFDVKPLFKVPKAAFSPQPDTESVVVEVRPRKGILRTVLLSPKAKVKNAIMQALVEREKCTKNKAREAIKGMELSNITGEKQVKDMDLNDLRQLLSKLK